MYKAAQAGILLEVQVSKYLLIKQHKSPTSDIALLYCQIHSSIKYIAINYKYCK